MTIDRHCGSPRVDRLAWRAPLVVLVATTALLMCPSVVLSAPSPSDAPPATTMPPPSPGSTPSATTTPPAQKAELKVHRTGPIGFGAGKREFLLRIAGLKGAAEGTATLADAEGHNKVTVSKATDSNGCSQLSALQVAVGNDDSGSAGTTEWCLKVAGLEPGSEATGTLSSPQTELTLTLGVRHNYWFGPALVTLLALVLAVVGVVLGPDKLGGFVRSRRLEAAMRGNARRLADHHPNAIEGLDAAWLRRVALAGVDTSSSAFVAHVQAVIDHGPARADDIRARLSEQLQAAALPAMQPLRGKASDEAGKTTYAIGEFLDEAGAPRAHPASMWVTTIQQAEQLQRKLTTLKGSVNDLTQVDPATKGSLRRRVDQATKLFDAAADSDGLDDVEGLADGLLLAVNEAAGQAQEPTAAQEPWPEPELREPSSLPGGAIGAVLGMIVAQAWGSVAQRRHVRAVLRLAAGSARMSAVERWWPTIAASLAIVVAVSALMVVAAGTIAATAYTTSPTFGSATDYWKLFFAALGSSAATGVVSTLLLWRPRAS